MDKQDLLNIAFGACSGVLGWFARELWAAVKELKSDLAKLREELPKSYIIKEDYHRDIDDIKKMLIKIFDKLEGKVDK